MDKFEYKDQIGFRINRTAKALTHAFDQELRKNVGISIGQWKIIIVVYDAGTGLTQKEIAGLLDLEGSTLIPIIDKLEKDELIKRTVDIQDRRNNRIFLTAKSEKTIGLMLDCGLKINNWLTQDITEEDLLMTKRTLEKILHNIQTRASLDPFYMTAEKQKENTECENNVAIYDKKII